jgi:hypothetical protein
MRGNLPVLYKKPGGIFFFLLMLLMVSFLAITQETEADDPFIDVLPDEFASDPLSGELPSEEKPLALPRWFRSNAGGMTLEEIPSRLAALRNEYALVIDHISTAELPELLLPYYHDDYSIEIRVLYKRGKESRRQWLFHDAAGTTRLAAVFNQAPDEIESEPDVELDAILAEVSPDTDGPDEAGEEIAEEIAVEEITRISRGFIELYNEDGYLSEEYVFAEDGGQTVNIFFYRSSILVTVEGWQKMPGAESQKIHTDHYRYNRSAALRSVERIYHAEIAAAPVRIAFPYRVLDAARDDSFMYEQLPPEFEFFGDTYAAEGYRMVFTTGERGRILTQTLLDSEDNPVWIIQNTWSGDRIIAILKTEGNDEWLIEFEFDGKGNRILERNLRNGVLERLVRAEGSREIEELYMDGVAILRAIWENGRKISEERIRNRQSPGNRG